MDVHGVVNVGNGLELNAKDGADITVAAGASITTGAGGHVNLDASLIKTVTGDADSLDFLQVHSAEISVTNASINAGSIDLHSHIDLDVTINAATAFGSLNFSEVLPLLDSTVTVSGSTLQATGTISVHGESDVTTVLTRKGQDGKANTDTDAGVAVAVIVSNVDVGVVSNSTLTAQGNITVSAGNTVHATTTADGTLSNSAGAMLAVTVITGDTNVAVRNSTLDGASLAVTAASDRTGTTLAKAAADGASKNNSGSDDKSQKRIKDPNNDGNTADAAKTGDGSNVDFAATVAVGILTGDTTATIESATLTSDSTITVSTSEKGTMTTTADGSFTDDTAPGIGVAVAVGVATADSTATIIGANTFTAPSGASLSSTIVDSHFDVTAKSGAGNGGGLTAAGALAINMTMVNAVASLASGASVDMNGGDLSITATSATTSNATADSKQTNGKSVGLGASVAINFAENDTQAVVAGGANVTEIGDLGVNATSTHNMTTIANGASEGGTAITPVAALSFSTYQTEARIDAGGNMTLGGALTMGATNTSDVTTTGKGATNSDGSAAIGASFGLAIHTASAMAVLDRNLSAGGAIALSGRNRANTKTGAEASASGSEDKGGGDVNNQSDTQRSGGDNQGKARGSGGTAGAGDSAKANTSDGPVAVAAAVAVNVVDSDSGASIGASRQITSGGQVTLTSQNNTDTEGKATGAATGAGSAGIGVAVALNHVDIDNVAAVGNGASIDSHGLAVSATMFDVAGENPDVHKSLVEAKSGAGADDVGIAGGVGINLVDVNTAGRIGSNATLTQHGGNVQVLATALTVNKADALPEGETSGDTAGIGASVAFQVVDTLTVAEILGGGSLTGGGGLTVKADATHTTETNATHGAAGKDFAFGGAVSVALVTNTTRAQVEAGTQYGLAGNVLVEADHTSTTTSLVKADVASKSVGIGIAVSVNVVNETAEAKLNRSLNTGGNVSVLANTTVVGKSEATASAGGGKNSDDADSKSNSSVNSNANKGQNRTVPNANSTQSSGNGQATSNADSSGASGVGVAASAAVNSATVNSTARIAGGADVTASGPLVVRSLASVDENAQGVATAVDMSNGDVNVGAALGLNVATVNNYARIESGSVIVGSAVAVEAVTPQGARNDYSATAYAAGGNKSGSAAVSAVAALNVLSGVTDARVDGNVQATSGNVNITGRHSIGVGAVAASAAGSQNGQAVGAAVAMNLINLSDDANNLYDSGTLARLNNGAQASATGGVNISATTTIDHIDTIDLPTEINSKIDDPGFGLTSLAVAAGASSGGAAVAGSASINVIHSTTIAEVGADATIPSSGSVSVNATNTLDIISLAGTVTLSADSVGVGAGLDLNVITKDTRALIGAGANVQSGGDVAVSATSSEDITSISVNGSVSANSAGIAVSASVAVLDTNTLAAIADGTAGHHATVSGGDVSVNATGNFTHRGIGGALAVGSSVGIGGSNETLVHTDVVEAVIGNYAVVTSSGANAGTGVTVNADSDESIIGISAAGGASNSAAITGSASINIFDETTTARVGQGAHITTSSASGDPGLSVLAEDTTSAVTIAGSLALSGSAGIGVGVDVSTYNKTTKAYIDSGVVATIDGNINVSANATEDLTSVAAGISAASNVAVSADGSVQYIDNTTRAFIGAETGYGIGAGDVHADGTVRVVANNATEIDKVVGAAAFSGTAGVTAGAGVTVSLKTTEAYIGKGAKVAGDGATALSAPTGAFDLNAIQGVAAQQGYNNEGGDNTNAAGIEASGSATASSSQLSAKGEIAPPTPIGGGDPDEPPTHVNGQPSSIDNANLSTNVHLTPTQASASGVIVGATSNDDIESYAIGISAAGSVAVSVAASVNVVTANTSAFIDNDADVDSLSGDITVVAGNDFRHTAAAAGLAIGGSAGIAPAVDVTVSDNKTKAEIRSGANATAGNDVVVSAKAVEDILLVGVGAAGGTVGIGGGINILSVNAETKATVSGTVRAGGDAIVRASDDTSIMLIDGGLGVGYVGVGAGVGVVVLDKHTVAEIADGADVTAKGFGNGATTANGTMAGATFNTTTAHGVLVEANSSEDVFHLAIAAGGGFVGAAGAVSVDVLSAETKARIGNADINKNGNTNPSGDQDVFVVAADRATVETYTLGLAGGFVGIGGSVDIGTLNNDTRAVIDNGADVHAADDINVNAVAYKELDTVTISAGGGFVGVAGSINVWSIGTTLNSSYENSEGDPPENSLDSGGNGTANDEAEDQSSQARNASTGHLGTLKNVQGNGKTSGRINTATTDSGTSISGSKATQNMSAKVTAAPTVVGTSAIIANGSITTADGDIGVRAAEVVDISTTTGGIGGGAVGAAAGISVLSLATNVTAAGGGTMSSGGAVVIHGHMQETLSINAFAVGAGAVGLGAGVAVIHDTSTNSAMLSDGGIIVRASSVEISATTIQNAPTLFGGQFAGGAAGIGAVWVDASFSGFTTAKVGANAEIGQAGAVGSLLVAADATIDVNAEVIGANGGVIAAGANFSFIRVNPQVRAAIEGGAKVTTSGAIDVNADTHVSAKGSVVGASGGGIGVTLSWSEVTVDPTVTSALGLGAMARSNGAGVNFRARHNAGPGDGNRKVTAESVAASGSGVFGGAGARSEGVHSAKVKAEGLSGSTVAAAGLSGFLADNNGVVVGSAKGGSGSLGGAIAFMSSTMTSDGSSIATFNGTASDSSGGQNDFKVSASATRSADSENKVISVGLILGGAAALGKAVAGGDTLAYLDADASVDIGGDLTVFSTTTDFASGVAEGGAGGLIGASILDGRAVVNGTSEASLRLGAEVLGAANVDINANGSSTGTATAGAATGGAISAGGVEARVTVTPTVKALIADNVPVTGVGGFIRVKAEQSQTEGDATGSVYGGGLAQVGIAGADGVLSPTVIASIGNAGHIEAGGDVRVEAISRITDNSANFTDFFDAGAVDYVNDIITFSSHGLVTGDTVVLVRNGNPSITSVDGSLDEKASNDPNAAEREYAVIVRGANTLTLGKEFDAGTVTAAQLFYASGADIEGIDAARDMVRFATPHKFVTGDAVRYENNNNASIGLAEGTYFVRVVDDYTIQLFATKAQAQANPTNFTRSNVDGANNLIDLAGFANGDRVTYYDPTPIQFAANGVDVGVSGHQPNNVYNANDNTIFVGEDAYNSFTNGDKVVYRTNDAPNHIGGLTDGFTYYVIKDAAFADRVRLATSLDGTNGDDPNNPNDIGVTPQAISGSTDPNSAMFKARHWLVRPALGNLENGRTYTVINAGADGNGGTNDFQLSLDGVNAVGLSEFERSGTFALGRAGLDLASASGKQELVIDMVGGSGQHMLMGPGAVSLRVSSPPAGDGTSSVTAKGGGGGVGAFGFPTSKIVEVATVQANIGSDLVESGGSVIVDSFAQGKVTAYTSNGGGGVIQVGETDATARYSAVNDAFIGDANNNKNGAGIDINAKDDILIGSSTDADVKVTSRSTGGGLLAFADADSIGSIDNAGAVASTVGNGAHLLAGRGISVTTGYDAARMDVYSRSEAGGLTGTSNADSYDESNLNANIRVGAGAIVDGIEGVDVRVVNNNLYDKDGAIRSSASFYGISIPDDTDHEDGTLDGGITTENTALFIAGPRIPGDTALDVADLGALPSLALLSEISSGRGSFSQVWNADVILQSGPSPTLVVNAAGLVVTAVNVTVDNGHGVGWQTSGASFKVDDIINDDRGQAMFKGGGSILRNTDDPLFTFRDTYRNVTLTNESDRTMRVSKIDVINRTAVTPAHEVFIRIPTDSGFQFDVTHDFKPTFVLVENTRLAGGRPDIDFTDEVNNPIGVTTITNQLGDIYSTGFGVIRTDSFRIFAANGSVGVSDAQPLRLEIVESNDGPTGNDWYRLVDAHQNVFLDVRGLQRRAPAGGETADSGFIVDIQHVQAGQNANIRYQHGLDQTTLTTVDYKIEVDQSAVVIGPTPAPVDSVTTHFRSNQGAGPVQVFPLGVFGTGAGDTNTTYLVGTAPDAANRLIAGGDINVVGPTSGALTHFTAFTEVQNLGNIDVIINGDVRITEVTGDLRVGRIASIGRDVFLKSPRRILDATSGSNPASDLGDSGVGVDADVAGRNIEMTAGDNGIGGVEGQGGIGQRSNFLEINTDIVNGAGGIVGSVRALDTSSGFNTQGIFLTEVLRAGDVAAVLGGETTGDLKVHTIDTKGDVTLSTQAGSIVDARNNGAGDDAADVLGNTVNLYAVGGNVGTPAATLGPQDNSNNDLEIDSQHYAAGTIGARATGSIFLTETDSNADVVLLQSTGGDIRFTVRESADLDEDFNLLHSGSVLLIQNAPETVPNGFVNTPNGSILLRVGDDVNTNANARIVAGRNIDIYGDFARTSGPVLDVADPGWGTIMHLAGHIQAGPNASGYLTEIFGNADADTIHFDQTFLDSKTRAYGSNTATPALGLAPLGDNEDLFEVNQLQTMNVAGGDTLTLDGQAATDHYVINTTGSQGAERNYVINVLDTGRPNDGVDVLSVYGADNAAQSGVTDDIFLLRRTTSLPAGETAARNTLYSDRSAFVALLHGTLAQATTSDPAGSAALRPQGVQRVNYDGAVNGRLEVFGLGGNDYFASDDNAAITTLDGGEGNDTFQIGQLYGLQRDALEHTSSPIGNTVGGSLAGTDVFGTVATTRGWLSRGNSEALLAVGGTGDDTFSVYSNQAATRLEGNDGNDLFVVRAFALAETTASGEIDWIDPVRQIARPKLTNGFSTAAETDIRTGAGNNQVQYNINVPVSIDGGNGFDKVVVLGTEFADHIVVTDKAVYGAGLAVSYVNVEVLEIDTLEGDDIIDVLSTAPGIATRVIGGLGSDMFNVAGDVTGDVVSRDIEGTSSVVNHDLRSIDDRYNAISVPGVDVTVARPGQGQVVIEETNGFTEVREGGIQDNYLVYLAFNNTDWVYVTVSGADAPQDEQVATSDPRIARSLLNPLNGETFLVAETLGTPAVVPASNFDRDIVLNGSLIHVPAHSIVLAFAPGSGGKANAKTVQIMAVEDNRAEGDRVVAASHSVLSADPNFNHAVVRNVEVMIRDNDQPGIRVTQLDPTTVSGTTGYGYALDRNTRVLEGLIDGTNEVTDLYALQLAIAPTGTVFVDITLSDNNVRLKAFNAADAARFTEVQAPNGFGPGIYRVEFNAGNWNTPLIVEAHARYDLEFEDPTNTAITHTVSTNGTTDAAYLTIASNLGVASAFSQRIDVQVVDDENSGVFITETGGKTLVSFGDIVNGPGDGDSYFIRLTNQPTNDVKIALLTDGQTDVTAGGIIAYEEIGRLTPSKLFEGFVSITGGVISLAPGSELNNFVSLGFKANQLIRLGNAAGATGDYTIASVTANSITLQGSAVSAGTLSGVSISRILSKGVFTGQVTYNAADNTLTRADGGSWLDNGFFEGQVFKFDGDGTLYKIESFSGTVAGKLDVLKLTDKAEPASFSGMRTMKQWAAVATFNSSNWNVQLEVKLLADPFFDLQPGRENLKVFSKPPHLLSGIRGPLAIEGGVTAADRSLKPAVLLPGEGNAPFFQIAEQPPEKFQIDTLNIYNDGSKQNLSGTLTSTALTGFNMGPDLVFTPPPGGMPFGEPSSFPGGISYGTIQVNPSTGQISQGNTNSTVEVVNVMLGQGNDRLDILSTLLPGPDYNADGSVGVVAAHGGITTVHGGGNLALSYTGSFKTTGNSIARLDGLSWEKSGFAIGQQVQIGANSYTVIGFENVLPAGPNDPTAGPSARMLLSPAGSGGAALPVSNQIDLTVSVRDWLVAQGEFKVEADRIIRKDGLSWQSPGFAIGQQVYITGIGHRTIVGFDNSSFGDGTALLLSGSMTPNASLTGIVAVTDRMPTSNVRVGGDTIVVSGGAGPNSPLVVYGDTSQDGAYYNGNPSALSLGIFGKKPMPHEDGLGVTIAPASIDPLTNQTIGKITRSSGSWIDAGFTTGSLITIDGVLVGMVRNVTASTLTLIDIGAPFAAVASGTHDVAVQNRIGNSAPFFVFPLANPFKLAGNDIIDASALFAGAPVNNLPSVGFTAYGGAGDDTIIGSQTGDHLAGGSGRDTIIGNRGVDHIYGDSGVNVDVFTRLLSIPTVNASVTVNRDSLIASTDELYGDARGSTATDIYGNFDDVIFGDHGVIQQDVAGPRDTTKPIPALPQFIMTTLRARLVATAEPQNGASDIIYGGGGQDILLGGTGDDAIDGGAGVDLIFGDHASLDRWSHLDIFTNPRFRTLNGTQIYSTALGSAGNDLADPAAQLDPRGNLEPRVKAVWGPVWGDYVITQVGHSASAEANIAAYRGNDYLAGGSEDDTIFAALGNDVVQGDGSIDFIARSARDASDLTGFVSTLGRVGAYRSPTASDPVGPLTWFASVDRANDGHDYIEGGGGNDVVFGNQGQDDILGGSSDLFGMTDGVSLIRNNAPDKRPDGSDMLFGGSGTHILRSDIGDATIAPTTNVITTTPAGHAADSDMILGDNGDIFRLVGINHTASATPTFLTFNYDDYTNGLAPAQQVKIVVRAARLLDYTPGGIDFSAAAASNIGKRDEVHGESGDDFIYGMVGDDALYGDGQDDDLVGGYGKDWISGGTGDDGVIGDDGRIFTSRNSKSADPTNPGYLVSLGESLYGITPLRPTDTDLKNTNGDALNEFIYTPGNVQTATINLSGALKKTVDITPFSSDPTWNAATDEFPVTGGEGVGTSTHRNDDIIYGGLGSDWLHGGSGDDAISGAEALPIAAAGIPSATQPTSIAGIPGVVAVDNLVISGFDRPYNPGNILGFEPVDADGQHAEHRTRAGEFALYDEYNPLRKIMVSGNGSTVYNFLLNFDPGEGVLRPAGTNPNANGQQVSSYPNAWDDGTDRIFGDLGNDWLVGGTGRDDLYGGFGNDLMNADDNHNSTSTTADPLANNVPDTHPFYEDRAYGGGGRDVLVGNTGGDRLIDWNGEFNSYLVPFAPFGTATVSRTLQPQLHEFLYALSRSDGADATRAIDITSADPLRNGEPFGELGLVLQKDAAFHDQQGGPSDPQAGNIPGGKRDVLRSASFNDGTTQGFNAVVGSPSLVGGAYQIAPSTTYGDAISLFDQSATVIPEHFEMQATINGVKPVGGVKANAYLIFDYVSDTDFKFAGINISTNKMEIGHRNASGWIVDVATPGQFKASTNYVVMLSIDGSKTTIKQGNLSLSFTFGVRVDTLGITHRLNYGLVGIGSTGGAASQIDDLVVQAPPGAITLDKTADFSAAKPASVLFGTPLSGTWATTTDGRYLATATNTAPAINLIDIEVAPGSTVNIVTTLKTFGSGGVIFDYQSATEFKYATLSADGKQIIIGHRLGNTWVVDATYATKLTAGTDYKFGVTLKSRLVNVSLNGAVVASKLYNVVITDGGYGLISFKGTTSGQTSFDSVQFTTDDAAYLPPASPQVAAAAAPAGTVQPISDADLAMTVEAAKAIWTSVLGAGDVRLQALTTVTIELANLQYGLLGQTAANTILIDASAAGWGWFVDHTPFGSSEFAGPATSTSLTALTGSAAYGRMDLLTTVLHEMSHAMGIPETAAYPVTAEALTAGTRLLPAASLKLEGFRALDETVAPAHVPPTSAPAAPAAVAAAPAPSKGAAALPRVSWDPWEDPLSDASRKDWLDDYLGLEQGEKKNPNKTLKIIIPPPASSVQALK